MSCLNIRRPRIIVFGDIMLDVQIHGSIEKIANEAPIPVLHSQSIKRELGGCGNVLMNLDSIGCEKLFIFSMIGADEHGESIKQILHQHSSITAELYSDEAYTTTVKTRGFSNKKIIFRYDIEKKTDLSEPHKNSIELNLDSILTKYKINSIILSDYNKGFMTKSLSQMIITKANEHGIPTFVDPKVDYNKFINCTVFKPNIKEIKDIFNITYSFEKLKEIHLEIQNKVKCKETLLTLSEQGITYLTADEFIHQSTVATEVNDVTGAGDVVLAVMAYFYGTMTNVELIRLATWAGTHSVKYTGTYILERSDILESYKAINGNKYVSVDSLKYLKNPIVFTNGCFDIVHEGHLSLFRYCKSIKKAGGYVVVALNSDESIKSLKGPSRPINNLQARIALLNAIECIDWIVSFSDDTPYNILEQIRPDTLVKGGDYTADSVIGKEFCREVRIFKFVEGKSTTKIIEKIKVNATK